MSTTPPRKNSQYESAFSRGNATSAGADHERDEEVREAGEKRDDDEEDHRRAVDRDQLVVAVGAEHALRSPA